MSIKAQIKGVGAAAHFPGQARKSMRKSAFRDHALAQPVAPEEVRATLIPASMEYFF